MSEPVRILQVVGIMDFGGAESFIMNIYRAIDRSKIQFDFIVHSDCKGAFDDEIFAMGGRIFHFPKFMGDILQSKIKWKRFIISHPEYKIIHSHIRSYASLYLPLAKRYGLITIIHSHSTSDGSGISSVVKKMLQYPLRNQTDYMFACSNEAGKWLFGEAATKKENYRFVPNCINIDRFKLNSQSRKEIRNRYSISDDTYVIGHVGNFRTPKNHEFIIKVFARLKEIHPNVQLLLVGAGELLERIKDSCVDLGIEGSVVFAGNQSKVEEYYCAFDCFFFPSLWEGLPMSVVEAQAAGLPCLLSDKISKDVVLTDLVTMKSLQDSVDSWAETLLHCTKEERKALLQKQKGKLMHFDSSNLAKWMESFYINQIMLKD